MKMFCQDLCTIFSGLIVSVRTARRSRADVRSVVQTFRYALNYFRQYF